MKSGQGENVGSSSFLEVEADFTGQPGTVSCEKSDDESLAVGVLYWKGVDGVYQAVS